MLTLIVSTLDKTLLLIPQSYRPETLLGFTIPGLGVVLTFVILLVTGVMTRNFVGQRLVRWAQSEIAERIGVSQMQVSRILANTLTSLRDQLE